MGSNFQPDRFARKVVIYLGVFLSLGCLGNDANTSEPWSMSAPETAVYASPSTRDFNITFRNTGSETVFLDLTLDGAPPAGWTITTPTSPIEVRGVGNPDVVVPIPITVPSGQTGTRMVSFKATRGDHSAVHTVTINIGSTATGIREVTPFTQAGSVFESLLEISWGEGTPWSTLMAVRPADFTLSNGITPGDAIMWFTPKSGGISLDPGDIDQVTVKLLPTTNSATRVFNFTSYFNRTTTEYGVNQQVTSVVPLSVPYQITAIDYLMGVTTAESDRTTTYTVKFMNVGAGRINFFADNVPSRFSAVVNPPSVDVSAGDDATVQVTITRVSDGSFEDTEEFTLRCTNSADGTFSRTIHLPIQSWRGS